MSRFTITVTVEIQKQPAQEPQQHLFLLTFSAIFRAVLFVSLVTNNDALLVDCTRLLMLLALRMLDF